MTDTMETSRCGWVRTAEQQLAHNLLTATAKREQRAHDDTMTRSEFVAVMTEKHGPWIGPVVDRYLTADRVVDDVEEEGT
jgi:hypothetical protein